MGGPFLPKKWVLGDLFSTENFDPGDQNFQDQNSGDRPCYATGISLSFGLYSTIHPKVNFVSFGGLGELD